MRRLLAALTILLLGFLAADTNATLLIHQERKPKGNSGVIGDTNVEPSSTDSNNFATGLGPYTIKAPQTVTNMSILTYSGASQGNVFQLGIYDSTGVGGKPGNLLAATPFFAAGANPSWQTVSVVTPVVLPPGKYWPAYIVTNNGVPFGRNFSFGTECYGGAVSNLTNPFPTTNAGCQTTSASVCVNCSSIVQNPPPFPVITSSASQTCTVGVSCSYQIIATGSPTSYSASGLPSPLTVNTATGLISGTPTSASVSSVTLGATNTTGTGNETLTLTINTALAPAFYVATTGSDSNAGTLAAPFATLPKCQSAMAGDPTKKTCYIRAGSYAPAGLNACNSRGNCAIGLGSADNGTTYSYYPPDGFDTADFTGGSTASGNGLWAILYTGGATNVTINGLSLHNFDFAAIQSGGGANLTVSNNLIFNGFGIVGDVSLSGASNAGGFMCYDCVGLTINNNVIHDIASFGMTNAHSAGLISNYLVQSNFLYNTCSQYRDCGAIYTQDLNTTKSTNLKIANNYVLDGCIASGCAPGSGGWGAGIYLDDCTNNYTITGNIVTGNNGTNNLMIHGGSNNSWSGNLFDMGPLNSPVLRFQTSSCTTPTGNTFENNVIVSDGASGGYNGTTGNVTVANNAYWNYDSGTLSSSGDSSPVTENPLIACNTYVVGAGSPVLSAPVSFPALPTSWGPPGFTIPATGTPRSTSIGCAIAANTFLNSMGINMHLDQGYAEAPYEARMTYTGIRNAREGYVATELITLHNNTVSGTYPGVKFDLIINNTDPVGLVNDGIILNNAGALMALEGPNEPNNQTFTYNGVLGGGTNTWVPVAQLQRDIYTDVKASALSAFPVFGVSELGAEFDNVGLQCLALNSTCPGASSVTLMAANTTYMDYANQHNYVQGNGGCGTPAANQAWNAEDPTLNSCWDGVYGDNVSTWLKHFAGYTVGQTPTLPKVSTETGWNSDSPSLDYQGKVLINTWLDGYKRGYAYTFIYEMVDQEGSSSNQGLYTTGNVAKNSATYVHNLTTILQDTTNFSTGNLVYSIASEPATVHDMLLQKANGNFYLVIWDEQTTTSTTDNITVTLGTAATVTEYDVVSGTSPINTFTSVTSVPLTLSDHAIILEIP